MATDTNDVQIEAWSVHDGAKTNMAHAMPQEIKNSRQRGLWRAVVHIIAGNMLKGINIQFHPELMLAGIMASINNSNAPHVWRSNSRQLA